MLSAIGRATARQVRVGGRLVTCGANRLVGQPAPRTAAAFPSGIRAGVVFSRGLAQRGRPRKTDANPKSAAAPKKKAATAKSAAKKTKTKTAESKRKVLTDEEKTKLKLKELKKKALLKEEPAQLPGTKWLVFSSQRLKELISGGKMPMTEAVVKVAAEYRDLPAAELEKLAALSEQNRVANEVKLRAWMDSRTPQEIQEANNARHLLRRKYNIAVRRPFNDPRHPKPPLTAYQSFIKSRHGSPELQGMTASDKLVHLAREWRGLGAEERKPFDEIAATDAARFQKEKDALRRVSAP